MSNFSEHTEIIKNWVEIVAVVLAGVWATFTFVIKDSPGLYQATEVSANIYLDSLSRDMLTAEVVTNFKNIGQQAVTLDSGRSSIGFCPPIVF